MAADEMPARLLRLREEASLLVEQGDYEGAYVKLTAARVLYDTAPDQERGGNSMAFRSIQELMLQIDKLRQEQRRGRGIQTQRIMLTNPSCY